MSEPHCFKQWWPEDRACMECPVAFKCRDAAGFAPPVEINHLELLRELRGQ